MNAILPIVIFISFCLLGCASSIRLPYVAPINQLDAPNIRWSLPSQDCSYPSLSLTDHQTGKVLCRVRSVFDHDWVASMGNPEGDSIRTFRSPTNKTILVHECASESSPVEHLVVFSKSSEGNWTARSFFPPSRPTKGKGARFVYDEYAAPRGIDDHYLYHQFADGKLLRIPFADLQPRDLKESEN